VPQLIPAGALVTDPVPVPDFVRFKVKVVSGIVTHDSFEGLEAPLVLNDRIRKQ
jgi:hypothetical protein